MREVTFAELAGETSAFANASVGLGVEAGDRAALDLPNSVAFDTGLKYLDGDLIVERERTSIGQGDVVYIIEILREKYR